MKKTLFLFSLFVSSITLAVPVETVNIDSFQKGSYWVWAFSESDGDGGWQEPYLYETYKVINRSKEWVTIGMSSAPSLDADFAPHHKFKANLIKCLDYGQNSRTLKRWKVQFFSKSLSGNKWQLVSRSHKGLVFTEKFNCLTNISSENLSTQKVEWEGERIVFGLRNKKRTSWYLANHPDLMGVTHHKVMGKYKLQLVDFQK